MYILNAKGILKDFGLFMHTYIIYNKSEDIYFEKRTRAKALTFCLFENYMYPVDAI